MEKDLKYQMSCANADMIYTDEDKEKFKNATHCHICEESLPDNSTKIDHIKNVQHLLYFLGLPKWIPTAKKWEKEAIVIKIG